MFQNLMGLAWGLVAFAIIVAVGIVVLQKFGTATANCASGYSFNESTSLCQNTSNSSDTNSDYGTSTTNMLYLNTQLGTSGLASWAPAIIALSIGLLFLGAFMTKGLGGSKGY